MVRLLQVQTAIPVLWAAMLAVCLARQIFLLKM